MSKRINLGFRFFKEKNGSALLMVLLILSGMLIVSLMAAGLVSSSLKLGRNQGYSTRALFAAETGAERALAVARDTVSGFDYASCNTSGQCVDFDNRRCGNCTSLVYHLADNSSYKVVYSSSTDIVLTSNGEYSGLKRAVQISFRPGVFSHTCSSTGAEICNDLLDNDCNGYIDCSDAAGCASNPLCLAPG